MTIDKKKIISIVLAVLAGLGAAGLVIWQPWNRAKPPERDPVQKIEEDEPPQSPAAQGPTLSIGGKDIACTLYEGDGWSIYVPEGWTVREGPGGMWMSLDEAVLEVWRRETAACTKAFAAAAPREGGGMERLLSLPDGGGGTWEIRAFAANEERWAESERLLMEVARTFQLDGKTPFADWRSLAEEPDWQEAEGMTVLFLDKDGFVLDGEFQGAVEAYMAAWPQETRVLFTGAYRVDRIRWYASYTELTDGYVAVFAADVSYEVAEGSGRALGDIPVEDGWALPPDGLLLAVYHDGSAVERTKWLDEGAPEDLAETAALLVR